MMFILPRFRDTGYVVPYIIYFIALGLKNQDHFYIFFSITLSENINIRIIVLLFSCFRATLTIKNRRPLRMMRFYRQILVKERALIMRLLANRVWGLLLAAAAFLSGCGGDGNPSAGGGGSGSFKTVTMGGQTWTVENLNIEKGNSWCYDNKETNCRKYGRLYDWETAMTVCPSGWRLPSADDWNKLLTAAGGSSVAGKRLKAKSGWYNGGNGTDSLGFSALPGGHRYTDGLFANVTYVGYWWSATTIGNDAACYLYMDYGIDKVYESDIVKSHGFSVRCVKAEKS
jgi:uncharacterized protein (TIGR02145 family)